MKYIFIIYLITFAIGAQAREYRIGLGYDRMPNSTVLGEELSQAYPKRHADPVSEFARYTPIELPESCFNSPGVTELNGMEISSKIFDEALLKAAMKNYKVTVSCGDHQAETYLIYESQDAGEWEIHNGFYKIKPNSWFFPRFLAYVGDRLEIDGHVMAVKAPKTIKSMETDGVDFVEMSSGLSMRFFYNKGELHISIKDAATARRMEGGFKAMGYRSWYFSKKGAAPGEPLTVVVDLNPPEDAKFTKRYPLRTSISALAYHVYPLLTNQVIPAAFKMIAAEDSRIGPLKGFVSAIEKGNESVYFIDVVRDKCNQVIAAELRENAYADDGVNIKTTSSYALGLKGSQTWIDWRYESGVVVIHAKTTGGFYETARAKLSGSKRFSDSAYYQMLSLTEDMCTERRATVNGSPRSCKTATKSGSQVFAMVLGRNIAFDLAQRNGLVCD